MRSLKKYILVARNTWDEMATYRLSFIIWRLQNILQLLTIYFLWYSLLPANKTFAGYNQSFMLTYVLGTALVSTIVWSSKTAQIGDDINEGNLSNFLLRPIGYMRYWFAKDVGDKIMNILFSIAELLVIVFLLKPPLFFQTNIFIILLTIIALVLGVFLYFYINIILGFIAFWNPETWAPRFIFFTVITFLAGGLFPLDILPKNIYIICQLLPFQYMLYFPIKLYLGELSFIAILQGVCITVVWVLLLYKFTEFLWHKGLKTYTSHGQ